ncbi:N-6 DNA methylase [Saccharopolyspora shandongensis]|uniref:N-6 DNA methylase n=1 Tax=Saccharopolyspora shandongensis TaxID=418495 RepID=UPI003413A4B9
MTNKQLNFVQRIAIQLDIPGRAAVVVQDNVLFEAARAKPFAVGQVIACRLIRRKFA